MLAVELILALATLISAGAAWRKSHKNEKSLQVSNGIKVGWMVEKTYEKVDKLESEFDCHIEDPNAHA